MSSPSQDLKDYLALHELSRGFVVQFGLYEPSKTTDKYMVIKPVTSPARELIRAPFHSLTLIGAVNSSSISLLEAANGIIEKMRSDEHSSGRTFTMKASEPALFKLADARPVMELSIEMLYS